MEPIKDLIERLNTTDECSSIDAKRGSAIDKSIMETVCSLSNEPGLGGGYILLGVERDETTFYPQYKVTGVSNTDKLQLDLASQCSILFNKVVRPIVNVEQLESGLLVMKIFVSELPEAQKPLFFKNKGLPAGALRRIGSSDQSCTEDDLYIFYNQEDTLDSSVIKDTSLEDISEEAIILYRKLRKKASPSAEELNYEDNELLQSLGCIKKVNGNWLLTYTGLLVFGKRQALRRILPMVRVDYIRVPGNEWVEDPENRFTTVDMRGPLIELVQRTINTIADDLPRGFSLPEKKLQAESIGLPDKVLREAVVNAFIHRTYRENQPIQIIRYGNRIEIKNPGFSLKPEDQLGEPGSKSRNPSIAAIFHETNLAETKGSGIRVMQKLMKQAGMVPPTFESNHSANQFTIRLLLHHFLNEEDIIWLQQFHLYPLNDQQKGALIFIREVGAIDNSTFRQLNGCDPIRASGDLRNMRDLNILNQKGKGSKTYYVPDVGFVKPEFALAKPDNSGVKPDNPGAKPDNLGVKPDNLGVKPDNPHALSDLIPANLKEKIKALGKKTSDKERMNSVILELCRWRPLTFKEIALLVNRNEKYMFRIITPLRVSGKLEYTIPEMPNHPDQAYKTVIKEDEDERNEM